ncbi:hypothetical protein V1291_004858 [Nitrobacteraceae bacterium AZCC 1564]
MWRAARTSARRASNVIVNPQWCASRLARCGWQGTQPAGHRGDTDFAPGVRRHAERSDILFRAFRRIYCSPIFLRTSASRINRRRFTTRLSANG